MWTIGWETGHDLTRIGDFPGVERALFFKGTDGPHY